MTSDFPAPVPPDITESPGPKTTRCRSMRAKFRMFSSASTTLRNLRDGRSGGDLTVGREDRDPAGILRGEDHALALRPADRRRIEVRHEDDLAPDEGLRVGIAL